MPADFEDRQLLEDFLSQRKGKRVEIKIPQRGVKRTFVDLVNQNAKLSFDQRFRVLNPSGNVIVKGWPVPLGLETAPRRIECFDISNIQGTDSVASMVVWEDGKMKKSDYRKFIIKTVEGADDFRSIREVVFRRYKRLQDEGTHMPDLVLIDGGLGQLHAAASALEELDLPDAAAGQHRQERGNPLRIRQRGRTRGSRQAFAGAASGSNDSRRNAPLCRHVSPPAPLKANVGFRHDCDSRRRRENQQATLKKVWQRAVHRTTNLGSTRPGDRSAFGPACLRAFSSRQKLKVS